MIKVKVNESKNLAPLAMIAVVIFSILALTWRYNFFTAQPFLNGADAYYYALQVKFFTATDALKIPDNSPLMRLMGITGKLGLSCEATIIFWTILIQLLCGISIIGAYRLIQGRIGKPVLPAVLFVWAILSPTLTFTCIEFPRYAFSFIFLPFWPVGLVRRKLWPVSVAAVFFSCISHLTMIGLLVVIEIGLTAAGIARLRLNRRKWPLIVAGAVTLILGAGLVGGKFLLIADLERIKLEGMQPILWTYFTRAELPLSLKVEVLAALVISIVLLLLSFRDKRKLIIRFWSPFILFLLLIPLGSKEVMGIPERLCLMLPLIGLCMMLGLSGNFYKGTGAGIYSFLVLTLISTAIWPAIHMNWVHPNRLNPDYALYERITRALDGREIPMLIAHQGFNYYYKYKTLKESFPYEPESHWPKEKIWRIVYGVTPSQWAYYLPEKYLWGGGLLFSLTEPYSLVREDVWNQFRDKIRLAENKELEELVWRSWLNPSQKRPEFVRKRAPKDSASDFSAYP